MTEEEWLEAIDPYPMLEHLGFLDPMSPVGFSEPTSPIPTRKHGLFEVACWRRIWHLMGEVGQRAIEVYERFMDGLADPQELYRARNVVQFACERGDEPASSDGMFNPEDAAEAFGVAAARTIRRQGGDPGDQEQARRSAKKAEATVQAALLREIFGNPFRPVSLDASWLTSTVKQLAQGIYEDRAFDRMPILADALQDAGCDNDDVLKHCRDETQPHVLGCWVVDMLLGKV